MNTTLNTIRKWIMKLQERSLDKVSFIPLTRDEIMEITSEAPISRWTPDLGKQLFGIDIFNTPFAVEMRMAQMTLPVGAISEHATLDMKEFEVTEYREKVLQARQAKIVRRVCHDTTKIKVTLEWDSLATFKRRFHLTRWWPICKRTIEIEGRVLYPYLKLTLPQNRHHVTFYCRDL